MPGLLDDQTVEIPCPGCGHKAKQSIAWLKAHDHFVCGGCRARVDLEKSGFDRGIGDAERAMDDFRRALRNFGR